MTEFRKVVIALAAWLTAMSPSGSFAEDLIVYTENYPPYNYLDGAGEVQGVSTKRVRQVLDAAGLSYSIRLVPWSRAVLYATTRENTLIYTITRTPSREEVYDWIVPLAQPRFHLYARADDFREVTAEALKAGRFTAACVSGDLSCDILTWAGIPDEQITTISDSGTGDFRAVLAGRADLYVSAPAVNGRLRQSEGFRPDVTKPVRPVGDKVGFFLAAGRQIPAELRARIRESYERLVSDGRYQMISAE